VPVPACRRAVEFAAWIIFGKTADQLLFQWRNDRRQRLEKAAVTAEYDEAVIAEYEVDEALPARERVRQCERKRERQRQLLMRYPQHLIASPAWRYFKEAKRCGLKPAAMEAELT
jgi:hypothetical protein